MTSVQSLEQQVQKLSAREFAEFRDWFLDYQWQAWDEQLEQDVKGGKLDELMRKARADQTAGRTKPL